MLAGEANRKAMLAEEGVRRGSAVTAAVPGLTASGLDVGESRLRALDSPPATTPVWLRATDECQRSLRRPLPVAVDVVAAASVTLALSGSAGEATVLAATLLPAGLAAGIWKHRSCVQAQGVSWYARRLAPTAVLCAGVLTTAGGAGARPAAVDALSVAAALVVLHSLMWLLVGSARRRGLGLRRTLLIGSQPEVSATEQRISFCPEAGLAGAHSHVVAGRPHTPARSWALIEALLADHGIEHVVCTAGDATPDSVVRDVIRYAPPTVDVTVIHPVPLTGVAPTRIGDVAVTCLGRPAWGADASKRVFDLTAALLLLAAISPILLVTAAAIRVGDPGPIVFRQKRTGRGNRQFTIYKFRSMVRDAEALKSGVMDRNVADGLLFKAENDPRITPVGGVIRRFSVDELPQLLNVVRGQMSLVGPRPLPTVFDEGDVFAGIRHRVLPGITGLWQVKGANALPYEDMIDLDCSYVATRSLGADLRILLQTVPAVLVRRDPY